MIGVVLVAIAQVFAEIGTSMAKYEVVRKHESILAMGFLNAFWSTFFLLALGLFKGSFVFSLESLPTFLLRTVLELILMFVSLHAVIVADRSTFAFLRTLTIPLLLIVDLMLGYSITLWQIAGIALMIAAFSMLTLEKGLSRKGKMLSLLSALIPVATLSLYKYNITNFNSVEAEQTLIHVIIVVVLLLIAWFQTGENLFGYMRHPRYLAQSIVAGIAYVFLSYAYLYAPASVITAAKRACEILGAILSGRTVFHEKHLALKLGAFVLIASGAGLMAFA